MTRDDLRPEAVRTLAEAIAIGDRPRGSEAAMLRNAAAILDALTPSAKSTLARYLLGDAIDGLDAAWAAAEAAAVASGRDRLDLVRIPPYEQRPVRYSAGAGEIGELGPTPAAALRALAARLAEPKP